MNKPEIRIGARGWRHESWIGDFYPDDMPHEWWLTYYSNEFENVLVPWSYLRDCEAETVQTWLDDTHDRFVFFLEVAASASQQHVENILRTLSPRLGGVLITGSDSDVISTDEISRVKWIDVATTYAPMAVKWDSVAADVATNALSHRFGCYWRPEQTERTQCIGIGIAEISGNNHTPKDLKKIIEHCRSVEGATTISLFFGGDTPSIEEMRNAIMILQMLG